MWILVVLMLLGGCGGGSVVYSSGQPVHYKEHPDDWKARYLLQQTQSPSASYSRESVGGNELRVVNPGEHNVAVLIRSGELGRVLWVPAGTTRSVAVANATYELYFAYANEPTALYQGDSVSLIGRGVEIRLVKVSGGNYGMRRVR